MDLWYTEKQTENLGITCKVTSTLHTEKSEFQDIAILDTVQYGRMLTLDGLVMTTIADEFVYHEMITHVALNTHPDPKRVLVVGGGDGGAIREIIKHPSVEKATLVEIDGRVIEVSKQYLPEIAGALGDPRVEVLVEDGIKHLEDMADTYDVICIDSTDPIGPAVGLFEYNFYKSVHRALKKDGIMVAQTESPFLNSALISKVYKDISAIFPITRLYCAHIPTYPSGMWSFTMGSKQYDPLAVEESAIKQYPTKYYTPQLHKGCFAIPRFVEHLIK
ncbi:MAG TPA: polyamine aminopropyltransferase [Bacillota bacterium]|nr:polyamine aminopropyltransferase [Bacillota bacterium]